ncbi:hypothetical protein ACNQQN_24870 [Mycobacteroides chelonae]|uniref:hypothetical protein n=1 Tax=Mycobacteroides chelonae TaxID=1774 RepID=UPI003AAC306E
MNRPLRTPRAPAQRPTRQWGSHRRICCRACTLGCATKATAGTTATHGYAADEFKIPLSQPGESGERSPPSAEDTCPPTAAAAALPNSNVRSG